MQQETQDFLSRLKKRSYRSLPDPDPDYKFGNHSVYDPEPIKPFITYEQLRVNIWAAAQQTLANKGLKWHMTETNTEIFRNIIMNTIGDTEGKYNPNKGIYLYGPNSVGKTFAMKHICLGLINSQWSNKYQAPGVIRYVNYEGSIMMKARRESSIAFINDMKGSHYIDDLGYNDNADLVLYGNRENILPKLINQLYEQHQRGFNQYFSSNIPIKDIEQQHGQGTADRIREMCTPVLWDSDINLRTIKP
jgi:DNA replication protein DnaC